MTSSSESLPRPPLLVWESGDLHTFQSVAEAESALEPPDVRNGIYRGFDGDGRLLALSTTVRREKFLGIVSVSRERVSVALAEESPNHRDELKGILQRFLAAVGEAAEVVTAMTFEELVTAASNAARAIR